MTTRTSSAPARFPRKMRPLFKPAIGKLRWRVFYGGRGSAKSWSIARRLVLAGAERRLRILCAREYQASIKDSVHKLLADQIEALGLSGVYDVQDNAIIGANGTEFLFKGLRHSINAIKSLERIDICWIEEAQAVSKESLATLEPTIRADNSEIWISFNPGEATDPVYDMFITRAAELEDAVVVRVGYRDNPWLPAVLRKAARKLKRTDPEAYAHVWGGEPWTRSELQVFAGKYRIADLGPPQEHWGAPYFGLDFGFSTDPSELVKLYVFDSRLYIAAEAGGVQLDMDDLARRMDRVEGARGHTIYADAARPETINELKRRGFRVVAAAKWEGSVKDGVEYLRGQFEEIVIHPSCERAQLEARLYRYKEHPKTGDPLPKLAPGNDHIWDAVRYALSKLIRRGKQHMVWFPGMKETDD